MAAGLPTTVQDDSHIAAMIDRHFEEHKDNCVVRNETEELTSKIIENLTKNNVAVKNAKLLKENLAESEDVTESLAKFASSLTDEDGEKTRKEMAQVTELSTTMTKGFNNLETKEFLHHKSVNNDKDRKEATAVQPGMPVTEDVGTMGTTAVKGKETSETTEVKSEIQRREQADNSTAFAVKVELNEEPFQQQMINLDEQEPSSSVREKKEKVNATWKGCNEEFKKNANEVNINEESQQIICFKCKEHCGLVKVKSTEISSLTIHMDIPTLYNLYRLEHTCLSGSFPDSFEPLLITDKMREEADKVGLQLKLKATYDQARFDELELFFINRDGGGLKRVKVFDDVIEVKDAEEIHIEDEETDQIYKKMLTGRVDSSSHGKSVEDIQSKSEMERATLEFQLNEAKKEKATLEERCKELTQKLESTEQSLVSQRIDSSVKQKTLQSELTEKKKLANELEDKVGELEHKFDQSELKEPEKGHMMQASAATSPPTSPVVYSQSQQMSYQTDQSHTQGYMLGQMRTQRMHYQPDTQYTQKPQMYRSPPQGQFTSPYYQGQSLIPQEIQTKATQVHGTYLFSLVVSDTELISPSPRRSPVETYRFRSCPSVCPCICHQLYLRHL
ncbi:filamin A-interacting protein 1-like [Ptychodera flava]|uniref:filamin A-interacting protein 1-like n=1 Tax=Ptychodera flava TaxID=63121 RepID=UPI003969E923